MKKVLLATMILAAFSVLFAGCKSGGDPKAVLISFFEALGKKDIEAARKLATADSKTMLDMMEMGMKGSKDEKTDEKYNKDKMEFGEAKIEGDKASIPVKDKSSGETTNFTLKKENGIWKVAFDKSSIMQMGMEKMNEKGANPLDSLQEKVQDMDADSLKTKVEEGMKKLDSVKDLLQDMKTK